MTVYVKELGHKDSAISALYSCASTNPQKVELVAGETAKVSFYTIRWGRYSMTRTPQS